MLARHIALVLLLESVSGFRLSAPMRAPVAAGRHNCSLAFASHSGFGNQVFAVLKAFWIAETIGCQLLIPPVLQHFELAYGRYDACYGHLAKEKQMIASADQTYKSRAHLSFGEIFELNPDFGVQKGLADLTFLPHHCDLLSWMKDADEYSRYMQVYMKSTNPPPPPVGGSFTIGSGYNAAIPDEAWLPNFDRAFVDLSRSLKGAASALQERIASQTGARKGQYACLQVRNADGQTTLDRDAAAWVKDMVQDGLPLYLMSAHSSASMRQAASHVCATSGCVASDETLPKSLRIDNRKRLFLEMAVCAMAAVTYLPNVGLVIKNGTVSDAGRRTGGGSTLQVTMQLMSQMPRLHRVAKSSTATQQHLNDFLQCTANSDELCGGDESVEGEEEDFVGRPTVV